MLARAAWAVGCSWLAVAAAEPAAGYVWLDSEQLRNHCLATEDSYQPADRTVCVAYVQGFIDGTSGGQAVGAAAPADAAESLTERAIRTRAGSYLRRVDGPAPGYCIGDDVPVGIVLQGLIEHLEANPDGDSMASLVQEALVHHFPCTE